MTVVITTIQNRQLASEQTMTENLGPIFKHKITVVTSWSEDIFKDVQVAWNSAKQGLKNQGIYPNP